MNFLTAYGLIVLFLIIVLVIAGRMAKKEAKGVVIPRAKEPGEGSDDGALIEKNTCPVCGEQDFYVGSQRGIYHTIYCGNPKCRAAFMIVNYGPGRVWAHRDGQGPQHLYD